MRNRDVRQKFQAATPSPYPTRREALQRIARMSLVATFPAILLSACTNDGGSSGSSGDRINQMTYTSTYTSGSYMSSYTSSYSSAYSSSVNMGY